MFNLNLLKPKMNMKANLAFLLVAITAMFVLPLVSASLVSDVFVELDDVPASQNNAVVTGDVIPVEIDFIADVDATDVEISAWIQGFRSESRVDRDFADLIMDGRYKARLAVNIPNDLDEDLDDDVTDRELTLVVRIESDEGNWEEEYTIRAQREAHNLDVLLVEFDNSIAPGSTLPVSVVVKNRGRHEEDETFVTVSIPELGVSKTAFFEDLFPVDVCDDDGDCDRADSRERRIFLAIPADAPAGIYEVRIIAESDEAQTSVAKSLAVLGPQSEGRVLSNPQTKTFALGEEAVYDMILVNTGNRISIFNIVPESTDALSVSISDVVTTVPAGSSKIVKVHVKANREGVFDFGVTATSDNFVETATYTADVQGKASSTVSGAASNNVVVLTIVLAIIFVVLLVILIVLLTRKPERSEEFGESYY